MRRLLGLQYRDTQCGAKVLRREVVEDILPRLRARDLLFDVDLLATAAEAGHRIVEVPTIWIDQEGSRVSAVGDSGRMGASLLRLWARRRARRGAPQPRLRPSAGGRPWPLLTSPSSARTRPAAIATAASAASRATPRAWPPHSRTAAQT